MFEKYKTGGIIADIVVVVIVLFSLLRGKKQGLIYMALWLISVGLAVVGARFTAGMFSESLGNVAYEKAEPRLLEAVENFTLDLNNIDLSQIDFSSSREQSLSDEEMELLMKNEGFSKLITTLRKAGMSDSAVRSRTFSLLKTLHKSGDTASDFAKKWVQKGGSAAIHTIVRVLVIILSFFILLAVLRFLSKLISRGIGMIPLIGGLDHLLGAMFALLACAVVIFVLLYTWMHVHETSYTECQNHSIILKWLMEVNPLRRFFA